jgi:type II secretory pathway component PulF
MTSFAEFQGFNAELAALIRAGIPLESGIASLEQSASGGLAALSQRVQDRLRQGRTLVEALRQEEGHFSEAYLATVEAALRADELPAALDALATFGRTTEDVRQHIRVALLYPKIVAVMAYLLFAIFLRFAFNRWFQVMEDFGYPMTGFIGVVHALWQLPNYVFVLIPIAAWIVIQIGLGLWSTWAAGSHAGMLSSRELMRRGFWLPGVRGIYDALSVSQVCGLLSLLLRHNVPLGEALALVSRASTNSTFANSLAAMAMGVQSGKSLQAVAATADLPWLLRETLLTLGQSSQLAEGLHQAATVYRRRALRRADLVQRYAPIALTVVIGGSIAMLYALTVIIPLRTMFGDLMSNWS